MHCARTEDVSLIAAAIQRLFADCFPRTVIDEFTRTQSLLPGWQTAIGDSGLLGICVPINAHGMGMGAMAALPILVEAGRRLVPFPIAEEIAAAAALAKTHPTIASSVMAGETIVTIADAPAVTAIHIEREWRLSGIIEAVPWAAAARWLIAEVTLADEQTLVLVDLHSPSVSHTLRSSVDLTYPMSSLQFNDYRFSASDLIGRTDPAWTFLRTICAAAELQGSAQSCLELTVNYMKERKQFGQQIGRFQALKQIAATDASYIENMRVALEYAAWALDAGDQEAKTAVHIAKEYASEQARAVAEDSIQCHGGVGFTWDYGLHFYLRRILRLGASLGTAAEHREALIGDVIANLGHTVPRGRS